MLYKFFKQSISMKIQKSENDFKKLNLNSKNLTKAQQKLFELLFIYPERSFLPIELAKLTGISASQIAPLIHSLGDAIVQREFVGKKVYGLDIEAMKGRKRANNLLSLYESGLCAYLQKTFQGSTIVLFGSYSFGEDISTSDIDLCIIGQKNDNNLEPFQKQLHRTISLHVYDSWKDVGKPLKESIINGIVLSGGIRL
jgi:predicted nucleotidyltransferase